MSKIVVFNGSSRIPGNCTAVIDYIMDGIDFDDVRLFGKKISQYEDYREIGKGYKLVEDDFEQLIDKFIKSEMAVFITPVYWCGISGTMKVFIDRFSESLKKIPAFKEKIKNKKVVLIVIGGDEPHKHAGIIKTQFDYICDFLGMNLYDFFILEANMVGTYKNQINILSEMRSVFCGN